MFSGILNENLRVTATKKMIVNSVSIKQVIYFDSPFPRFLVTAKSLWFHRVVKSGFLIMGGGGLELLMGLLLIRIAYVGH